MSYQLYYAPGACSLAPHIVLRELGENFSLVKVSTKTHETEDGKDFYKINPKGYVPALGLGNGEVLTEGAAITQFLADNKAGSDLAPRAGTIERARVNEWLVFINSEIHKTFSPLFNPATTDEQKKAIKEKLASRFDFVEKSLGERSYLTGEKFTIADAYLFTVVNWSNFTGIDIGPWPKLKAFQARVAARPHTQAAMKAEGLI
ncbi:MAG: glutathione transferase GstA [Proteobacteria bacterium]|nr:glutathione transferase GstA [Pseudomonadota bacterium]